MTDRIILLSEEVEDKTVKPIIERIQLINAYDDEQEENKKSHERKPIKLTINTIGGDVYSCLGLIGVIENSKTPVHTYCYGLAASAGFYILTSGHKRFMHRLSIAMYHELSYGNWHDRLEQNKRNYEQSVRLQNILESIVINKTKINKDKLYEVNKSLSDWFIDADEALEFGVIDEIV